MKHQDILDRLHHLRPQTIQRSQHNRRLLQTDEARQGVGAGMNVVDTSMYHTLNHLHIDQLEAHHRMLRQIDTAIQRLSEGSYGYCAHCGDAIGSKRLHAIPFAIYCLDC